MISCLYLHTIHDNKYIGSQFITTRILFKASSTMIKSKESQETPSKR